MSEERKYIIVKEIIRPNYHLLLRSDAIVQLNTSTNAFFTLPDARAFIADLNEITGNTPYLLLTVPGKMASVDSEARKYMATKEALINVIAQAVIIRNLSQRIIGNFYLKFDKPVKPVKLFVTVAEAEKWLRSL